MWFPILVRRHYYIVLSRTPISENAYFYWNGPQGSINIIYPRALWVSIKRHTESAGLCQALVLLGPKYVALGVAWNSPSKAARSEFKKNRGPRFNIKMSSYQYRKSHCGDKTVVRPSYLHNGISYTGKTTSLYWIRALDPAGDLEQPHDVINQTIIIVIIIVDVVILLSWSSLMSCWLVKLIRFSIIYRFSIICVLLTIKYHILTFYSSNNETE